MILFLDLDGVLRRETSPLYVLDDDCRDALECAVRDLPDVRIVITSAWRIEFSLDEIRSRFSLDVASRIVGATPVSAFPTEFSRHLEVLEYLGRHGAAEEPWIAIDDDPLNYPLSGRIILIDPTCGFGPDDAERLRTGCARLLEEEKSERGRLP